MAIGMTRALGYVVQPRSSSQPTEQAQYLRDPGAK